MEFGGRDFDSGLIVKAGWLHVHMATMFCCCTWGAWEKRYVVVRNNTIFIYSGETATVPLRQFSLYGASCSADITGAKQYIYMNSNSQGNLDIQAKNVEECREWALALQLCAIKASGGSVSAGHTKMGRSHSGSEGHRYGAMHDDE